MRNPSIPRALQAGAGVESARASPAGEMIDLALIECRPEFIFVNNHLEGNSPG
jgi:hypothetical protein